MTEDRELASLTAKIKELEQTLQTMTVELMKDINRLEYRCGQLETDVYLIENTIARMEKDK